MKTYIHIVYFLAILCHIPVSGQIDAQQYGNEWIESAQSYFKFSISQDGIYRISYEALTTSGFPIESIAGNQIQLYSLGEEIPIRVSTDAIFGEVDYIEFHGQKNDGSVDALLYQDADQQQLNPFISLYSDERPYFLTWSEQIENKRYIERTNGLEAQGRPPKEPYYVHREIITYDDFHHKPTHDGRNFIRYSSLDFAEGFGSELASERTVSIPVKNIAPFGIDPRLVIRFGTNIFSRNWDISSYGDRLAIAQRKEYGIAVVDELFPREELRDGSHEITIAPFEDSRSKHTLSRIELHYPRLYEFDGEKEIRFNQQASILSRYIELTGFGGTDPILYNLSDQFYIFPEQAGDTIQYITGAAGAEHEWVLIDQATSIRDITGLTPVQLNTSYSGGDYLIISNSALIQSEAVQEYASYRSSQIGGNHEVAIWNVNDLVNTYGYGIKGHPIAIKNAIRALVDQNDTPDYVFLIGKAKEYTELKGTLGSEDVVPTFGIPGSDNLLIATHDNRYPACAVGRLAAQTPQQVRDYLNKIQIHETKDQGEQTIESQGWKKEVIHLSGGSAGIQQAIFGFLGSMGEVLSYNKFGADIFTFRKTTADPLERATSQDIIDRVSGGASLLTFFGHSAVGTFDFSLEDPSKYKNEGKTPVILSLGCHSGNIHSNGTGISEDFVLEKERGAIAFIASSGTAYAQPQFDTGRDMYDLLGGSMYGAPIGKIIRNSLMMRSDNPSLAVQTLIEQLTLHGDPAIQLKTFDGPDFIIDEERTTISPGLVDATTTQFTLDLSIFNLGAVVDEVLDLEIIHVLPNGVHIDTQMISIPAPANQANISIDINNPGEQWIGANRILIRLDPNQTILEIPNDEAEENNIFIDGEGKEGIQFFVFDNNAKPIFPGDFGIMNNEADFTMIASVNNGLDPGGQFVLQIDTTRYFNSSLFIEEEITNRSSLITWKPEIPQLEGEVYYWRIAPIRENQTFKSEDWQESSFVYLPESPSGWNQSHYFQWENNEYYKVQLSPQSRKFEYTDREWDIRVKNELREEGDFWVFVNNTPWASLNPRNQGGVLAIYAWDKNDILIKNNGSDFGSLSFSQDIFLYQIQSISDIRNIMDLLSSFPDGARVFFHTMLESEEDDLNVQLWDQQVDAYNMSLIQFISDIGASRVEEILELGTVPYTLIYDQGADIVVEDIATSVAGSVDLSATARTIWSEGTIRSEPLPAQGRWLRLEWDEVKEDGDESTLHVLGIRPGGKKDTMKTIRNDYSVNLTNIDPDKYPTIQLIYDSQDLNSKSAPQLVFWRVNTSMLPDAAFNMESASFQIKDTINAGEPLELTFDVINPTTSDMEPILVKYTLIDEEFKENIILKREEELPAGIPLTWSRNVPTEQLAGDYQVIIELNPNEEKDELTSCNNLGFTKVYIRPDKRNPLLDVTFDGRHINNGDPFSHSPTIVVSLRDDDSYVLLNNPEDFEMTLFYEDIFAWKLDPNSDQITWQPATNLDENVASFTIQNNLNQEGLYTLQVQAKDIAGNKAGIEPYRISFILDFSIDRPKLTVSPNPMTSYTEFDYFLSSNIIPEIFDLYIYSTDGRLVKHVDAADFGGIVQGSNRYKWDGHSDYGDRLTNGLYYYEFVNNIDSRKEKQKGSILLLRE